MMQGRTDAERASALRIMMAYGFTQDHLDAVRSSRMATTRDQIHQAKAARAKHWTERDPEPWEWEELERARCANQMICDARRLVAEREKRLASGIDDDFFSDSSEDHERAPRELERGACENG